MANDSAAVLSVAAARTCGVSRAGLGVCPDRLGGGIRIGLTTALPAAAVVGLGAVVPATGGFFTVPLTPAGARVHGNPMRTAGVVLATVTATTLAGYGLAWLRFRSGSIAAPLVAHASLNGAAYLAARFVTDAAALQPGRHS